MTDIRFIELANRWISDAQVKIKSEVAVSNEQARTLKALVLVYEAKIDAILQPNFDKQVRISMGTKGNLVRWSSRFRQQP